MKFAAVVLAAGASSRFGKPKQLLKVGEDTLVQRASKLAKKAGCSPVVVVLGAHQEAIAALEFPEGVVLVSHPDWKEGMGRSLAKGVKAIVDCEVDGVFVLLVDQPGVTEETLAAMKVAFSQEEKTIVRCEHEGVLMPPALFAKRLAQLTGESGGSEVIRRKGLWLLFQDQRRLGISMTLKFGLNFVRKEATSRRIGAASRSSQPLLSQEFWVGRGSRSSQLKGTGNPLCFKTKRRTWDIA